MPRSIGPAGWSAGSSRPTAGRACGWSRRARRRGSSQARRPSHRQPIPNNHRCYAVQWFVFAAIALVIYGLALRKRLKEATPSDDAADDPGQRPARGQPADAGRRNRRRRALRRARLALRAGGTQRPRPSRSSIWCSRARAAARARAHRSDRGCRRRAQRLRPTRDQTVFHRRMLAATSAAGVELIADLVRARISMRTNSSAKRGRAVRSLARACDTPDDLIFDRLFEAAFADQPLGRSVLGDEASDPRAMTRADCTTGCDQQYRAVATGPRRGRQGRSTTSSSTWPNGMFGDMAPMAGAAIAPAPFTGGVRIDRRSRRAGPSRVRLSRAGLRARTTYCAARLFARSRSAAARRRGCSSNCARNAALLIRSTPGRSLCRNRPVLRHARPTRARGRGRAQIEREFLRDTPRR